MTSATTDVTGLYRITNTGGLTRGATYTAKVTTFPRVFAHNARRASGDVAVRGVALVPFVLQLPIPKS